MRIVQFCSVFSKLSETFIYDLSLELLKQNDDVHVFTFEHCNAIERPFPNHRLHAQLWPSKLSPARWVAFGLRLFGMLNKETYTHNIVKKNIKRELKKVKPDLIHAHFGPLALFILPVAKSLKIPVVVTFHGYDVNSWMKKEGREASYRYLLKDVGLAIAVSDSIMEKISPLIDQDKKNKLVKLYNGTLIRDFPIVDRRSKKLECLNLLFVGRLVPMKAPVLLLKSFLLAKQKLATLSGPEIRLTLVGDGELLAEVKEFIRQHGLEESVNLKGALSHHQVKELMIDSDLYVQHNITDKSGNQEGHPVSMIESQASGVPAVGTYCGGVPEVVKDQETGVLCEAGDCESMADAICDLCLDDEKRFSMGDAAQVHARNNFDLENQVKHLNHLYKVALLSHSG